MSEPLHFESAFSLESFKMKLELGPSVSRDKLGQLFEYQLDFTRKPTQFNKSAEFSPIFGGILAELALDHVVSRQAKRDGCPIEAWGSSAGRGAHMERKS